MFCDRVLVNAKQLKLNRPLTDDGTSQLLVHELEESWRVSGGLDEAGLVDGRVRHC